MSINIIIGLLVVGIVVLCRYTYLNLLDAQGRGKDKAFKLLCWAVLLFIILVSLAIHAYADEPPQSAISNQHSTIPQSAFRIPQSDVPQSAVPQSALRYRLDLTRTAQAAWGLNAPVAAFAAQIHQESGWNPGAVSRVGAKGMAQFMPATAQWWCDLNNLSALDCQPTNPTWAMRALVGYDLWLFQRVKGKSEYDKLWAALRAYNGGLGHWQKEAAIAGSYDRAAVDSACGKARRSIVHCPENLGYPKRILITLQPRYLVWGRGVLS